MKKATEKDGLSARQKTTTGSKGFLAHVRVFWIFLMAASILVSACQENSSGQDSAKSGKKSASIRADSLNKPKVSIQVNKHYDDKGNVVGFDSTYSSYYSNVQGDTSRMDSLMHSFDNFFKRDHSSFFGKQFNSLFFADSLRYPDFFHDDFFMRRYELNDSYFRDMMTRMDSIKNQFYQEHSKSEKPKELKDL
jgi:hypothetical protein